MSKTTMNKSHKSECNNLLKTRMNMKKFLSLLILFLSAINILPAQTCPDSNHPHAIDLGIGVKFACCNVGASSPEQYGSHYAWGETKIKNSYKTLNYKHGGNNSYREYKNIGSDISGTQYDVAHVMWQGNWHMPTKEELELLKDRCKKEWVTYKRVEGIRFIGPNGYSIFLPASGSRWYDDTNYVGYSGNYWSSTYSTQKSNGYGDAYFLGFDNSWIGMSYGDRASGSTVRPIAK